MRKIGLAESRDNETVQVAALVWFSFGSPSLYKSSSRSSVQPTPDNPPKRHDPEYSIDRRDYKHFLALPPEKPQILGNRAENAVAAAELASAGAFGIRALGGRADTKTRQAST